MEVYSLEFLSFFTKDLKDCKTHIYEDLVIVEYLGSFNNTFSLAFHKGNKIEEINFNEDLYMLKGNANIRDLEYEKESIIRFLKKTKETNLNV